MKKNEWKLPITYNGKPDDTKLEAELVTMDKTQDGVVTSLGILRLDGKKVGRCEIETSDHWTKPRKVSIPRSAIRQALAHNLAKHLYTNGKLMRADELVCDWFSVKNTRDVVSARNTTIKNHFAKLGCNPVSLVYAGDDGTQVSFIFLDRENLIRKENSFEYSGRCYYWVKGNEKITVARIKINTKDELRTPL